MTFLADSWSDSPIGSRLQLGLSVRISISFRVRFPHALLCQTDELWLPCEKVCLQNDLGTHWRQLEVAYIEPIWNLDFLNFNLNHALEIGYALNLIESNTYHYKVLFFRLFHISWTWNTTKYLLLEDLCTKIFFSKCMTHKSHLHSRKKVVPWSIQTLFLLEFCKENNSAFLLLHTFLKIFC